MVLNLIMIGILRLMTMYLSSMKAFLFTCSFRTSKCCEEHNKLWLWLCKVGIISVAETEITLRWVQSQCLYCAGKPKWFGLEKICHTKVSLLGSMGVFLYFPFLFWWGWCGVWGVADWWLSVNRLTGTETVGGFLVALSQTTALSKQCVTL